MSDLMTALRLIISGDSAGAVKALEEVDAASGKVGKTTDELAAKNAAAAKSGHAGMIAMAAGAGLVVAAIGLCVDAAGKQEEAVIQVQKMTGLSAQGASELVVQMQTMGISADSVAPVLGRALKNAQGFADGATKSTSAIGRAFTDLGLSADALKGKNADQVLAAIRDQIDAMPAGMQRTADIMAIFGRSAMTNQGLLRYLTASNAQLDEINAKAKSFGLVFSQAQLDQAAKFGEMLRVIEMEFKGLAVQVGEAVIPALTDILGVVAKMLEVFQFVCNLMGPLKGVFMIFVVTLPGVLVFAVGLYKVIKAVDTLRESMTFMNAVQAIFRGRVIASTAATEGQTTAEGEAVIATDAETGALKAGIVSLGLYAIAIAAAVVAIYEIVKAYDAAANAAKQYKAAVAATNTTVAQNATQEKQFGNLPGAQTMAQIQASRQANAYKSPGLAGYAGQFEERSMEFAASPVTTALKWFGQGASFVANKPTVIGVGEKGSELVTVTPGAGTEVQAASSATGGGSAPIVIQFPNAQFYGAPTPAIAQLWATALAQPLGVLMHTALHGSRR